MREESVSEFEGDEVQLYDLIEQKFYEVYYFLKVMCISKLFKKKIMEIVIY